MFVFAVCCLLLQELDPEFALAEAVSTSEQLLMPIKGHAVLLCCLQCRYMWGVAQAAKHSLQDLGPAQTLTQRPCCGPACLHCSFALALVLLLLLMLQDDLKELQLEV